MNSVLMSNNGSQQTVFFGYNDFNTYNLGGNITMSGGVQFATYGIQNTMNLGGISGITSLSQLNKVEQKTL